MFWQIPMNKDGRRRQNFGRGNCRHNKMKKKTDVMEFDGGSNGCQSDINSELLLLLLLYSVSHSVN